MREEDLLRRAVESGAGFDSATDTERACRWALAEVERQREALVYIAEHADDRDWEANDFAARLRVRAVAAAASAQEGERA